ncbi:MAG TPA: flagellar basal body protein [Phycisphaerae bacterium]|nr:flagellar basal body protein [Phycisphaerae bacterium]
MTSILDTALSGLNRNMRGIEIAAQNVANVNTDGYRARREESAAGVTAQSEAAPSGGDAAADVDLPISDVDLATEFVDIKLHEIGYQANGLLVKVADRMNRELLDLLG